MICRMLFYSLILFNFYSGEATLATNGMEDIQEVKVTTMDMLIRTPTCTLLQRLLSRELLESVGMSLSSETP